MPPLARRRAGASLLELLVAMTILSVLMSTILTVLRRQQRVYAAAGAVNEMRDQLRDGAAVLPIDLRGVSSAARDPGNPAISKPDILNGAPLSDNADTKLSLRVTIGSSIICNVSGSNITLPPNAPLVSNGVAFTSWSMTPAVGDSVYILDESATAGIYDDVWGIRKVTGVVADGTNKCPTTATTVGTATFGPYVKTADAAQSSYTITLDAVPTAGMTIGAPIRFVTRVRYELFKSTDNNWYLGYCERSACDATTVALQPLVGPLRPYVSKAHANNGLQFTFFDSTGAATTAPNAVSRIGITLRGVTGKAVNLAGGSEMKTVADTLHLFVALRNRP